MDSFKLSWAIFVCILVSACSSSGSDSVGRTPVSYELFTDIDVYNCVNMANVQYMQDLVELDCQYGSIDSLSGLEYANNLESLSFNASGDLGAGNSELTDLTSLAKLNSLQSLTIKGCGTYDENILEVLVALPNLQHVSIASDSITDLNIFTRFQSLISLEVQGGCGGSGTSLVADLSPVQFIPNLRDFSLDSGLVSNLTPLQGAANLESLSLIKHTVNSPLNNPVSSSLLTDISPLASMTNLKKLELGDRGAIDNVTDISALATLINLEELRLINLPINDISPLSGLTKLKTLVLTGAYNIGSLNELRNLTQLEFFSISANALLTRHYSVLNSISPIANLTNLKTLYISDTLYLSSFTPISSLTALTRLALPSNRISDISFLAPLTNLENLQLQYNDISNIGSLASLTNLQILDLTENNISDINFLSYLTGLLYVFLSGNDITDISAFYIFPPSQIQQVYFYNNILINCDQVRELKSLGILPVSGLYPSNLCIN